MISCKDFVKFVYRKGAKAQNKNGFMLCDLAPLREKKA
jgi:hypothetical protein